MSFHSDPFHTDSSIHSMNVPSHEGEPVGLQRTSPNQMLSSRDKVEGEQSNKGLLKTDASFMKEYKGSLTKAGGAALMAVVFTGSVMLLPLTVAGGALGAGAALIAKARGMSDEQAGKLLTAGLIVGSLGSLGIGLAGVKLHSEGEKYSQKLAEKKEQPLAKEQLLHPSHRGLEESVSENKISSPEVSDVREPEIMHTVELSPKEIYQALIDTSKKKLEELAAKKEAIRNVDIPVAKEKIKESEEGILFAKNKLVESKAQYAAHLNEIRNDTSDPSKKRRLEEKVSEYEKADKHRKEELVKYSLMTLFQTELFDIEIAEDAFERYTLEKDQAVTTISKAESELQSIENQEKEEQAHIEELEGKIKELVNAEITVLKENIDSIKQQVEGSKALLKIEEATLPRLNSTLEDLNNELEDNLKNAEVLKEQIETVKSQEALETEEATLPRLNSTLEDLNEKLEVNLKRTGVLKEQIEAVKSNIKEATAVVSARRAEANMFQEALETEEAKLNRLENNQDEEVKFLKESNVTVSQSSVSKSEDLDKLEDMFKERGLL